MAVSDVTVTEGHGPTVRRRPVRRQPRLPASQAVTVKFACRRHRHGNDVDFRGNDGTLTFPAETNATQQVRVKVKGDTIHEGDEQFFLNLNTPVNASILDGQGVGTIHDTDPVPTVSVPAGPTNFVEGDRQLAEEGAPCFQRRILNGTLAARLAGAPAQTDGAFADVGSQAQDAPSAELVQQRLQGASSTRTCTWKSTAPRTSPGGRLRDRPDQRRHDHHHRTQRTGGP